MMYTPQRFRAASGWMGFALPLPPKWGKTFACNPCQDAQQPACAWLSGKHQIRGLKCYSDARELCCTGSTRIFAMRLASISTTVKRRC